MFRKLLEYGKNKGPCYEDDKTNIKSYFTWAKESLYTYLLLKSSEKNILLNWFRLFYVYGPGQKEGSLIPTLINSFMDSKKPNIKTPLNKNDFVFVKDVTRIFTKALENDLRSGVYNLGSGYSTSVYDICSIIEKEITGKTLISNDLLKYGQKDESVNFWANMDKIESALDHSCDTSIADGIYEQLRLMSS